jgi:hypothetical protein
MGTKEEFEAERLATYMASVEEQLRSAVSEPERAEVSGWFKLGAPSAHAAVSIKASRLAQQTEATNGEVIGKIETGSIAAHSSRPLDRTENRSGV